MTECFPFWVNSNSCLVRFFFGLTAFLVLNVVSDCFPVSGETRKKPVLFSRSGTHSLHFPPVEAEAVFVRGFYTA